MDEIKITKMLFEPLGTTDWVVKFYYTNGEIELVFDGTMSVHNNTSIGDIRKSFLEMFYDSVSWG